LGSVRGLPVDRDRPVGHHWTKACYVSYSCNYAKDGKLDVCLTFWQCEEYWMENKCRARMHARYVMERQRSS